MRLSGEQQAVVAAARERGVREVRVVFLDYNGLPRARSVMIDRLPQAFERGINFSSPTVDFNSRDLFPPAAAFDLASPDFWAIPDPATYRPAPGETGVGQLLADLAGAGGAPWEGCPRTALRRAAERAAGRGIAFNAGFEPEGYLFRDTGDGVELVGAPRFATADGLEVAPAFMRDLLTYLATAGVPVEQWSEEYGPGQVEVNLRYTAPPAAADGLVIYRLAFRSLARRHGLLGSFMPKPFEDQAGSGLHVHLSASPPDEPETNLFDDPGDELGLSTLGRQALAGLLAHGAALTALGASTVNSYRRFLPGSWAPTHIMYAYASRAAFVRIPERETARRLELRIGDGACNPYLYLTGILAAMVDGIERGLDPGPPLPGDVGTTAGAGAAPAVPPTLDRALEALEADQVMSDALGSVIFEEYIRVKRSEWEAYRKHVPEWDREWYLRRY